MRTLLFLVLAALLLPACKCFRPCPPTVDRVVYRDTLIHVPPVTVVDTLPIEIVRWDTVTQLVTIRVPETMTATERDGVRVAARWTASGIEVKATRVDTVIKVQNVERVRHVYVERPEARSKWWLWLVIGFIAGLIFVILLRNR